MAEELGVQDSLLAIITARGFHAISESELRKQSGLGATQFKEAMIRLSRIGQVVKWKNESKTNHIVATAFADGAYYLQLSRRRSLLESAFNPLAGDVYIQRSIPFVVLEDLEVKKKKHNRYRNADA